MSLSAEKSFRMKMRDVETAFKYRRFPYPKRSVELIALLAISCTFFLFMHTNKLNSRLKEMEMKLQPSEFSALGLTGSNHLDSPKREDINTLHGTYQYLKSTGQLQNLNPLTLNNTRFAQRDFLLFNRVPKVGSEQLIELLRRLSIQNNFQARRSSPAEPVISRLNEIEQLDWAIQFYDMGEGHSYAMHINYIDFPAFHLPQPIYINLIRDPVERVISWYFYIRTPWRAVQRYKRVQQFYTKQFYKKDLKECLLNKDPECLYIQEGKFRDTKASYIRQTLFFCGHHQECEPFNSVKALQRAKHIVETQYAVVGSWEDVNVTLNVMENYIPRYFKGATKLYYDSFLFKDKRNFNHWKPPIAENIKEIIRRNFTREYEFYYFCKQRLFRQHLALGNLP